MTLILLLTACLRCSQTTPVEPSPQPPDPVPVEEPVSPSALSIHSPVAGAVLAPGPLTVSGQASVWEGQFELLLRSGEQELARQHVDLEQSAPGRGDWSVTLEVPAGHPGPAVLSAYAQSPKDGAPIHTVEVAVTLE